MADAAPDVVAVCEFGQLIREPLLSQYTMLNVIPRCFRGGVARRR